MVLADLYTMWEFTVEISYLTFKLLAVWIHLLIYIGFGLRDIQFLSYTTLLDHSQFLLRICLDTGKVLKMRFYSILTATIQSDSY